MFSDVTFGIRTALKTPVASLVIVATLAMGIAATSVSFSLVNGLFIRPLPIDRPGQFVRLYNSYRRGFQYFTFSYPDFVDMRELRAVFADAVAEQPEAFSIGTSGASERIWGELVSDRYFQVLGVTPSVGRAFTASEDSTPGGDAVVILSDGLSRRVFASAAQAVTRALVINGQSFRVVGVAPAGFTGTTLGFVADLWIPSELETRIRPAATLRNRGMRGWFGMARLTPHATIDQARSALGILAERLEREHPDSNTGVGFTALRESDGRIFPMLRGSVVGLSAVTITVSLLVLIIACANVAGLLLVRASARRSEIGIRIALGATRSRIVGQLLTESALLMAIAGALGVAITWQLTRLLAAVRVTIARGAPVSVDVSVDARVLAVSVAAMAASCLLFGLAPALEAAKADVIGALKQVPARGSRSSRSRAALVGVQVAVSAALLAGGGLFLRSLQHGRAVDLGFDPNRLATASIDVSLHGYSRDESDAFWQKLIAAVRRLPRTEAASLATRLPLDLGITRIPLGPDGYRPPDGEGWPSTELARVDTDYFRTLKLPLVEGREFTDTDRMQSRPVVIVNEFVARQYWPGVRSVVGKYVTTPEGERFEVVGVARLSKYFSIGEDPRPYVYFPLRQGGARTTTIVARTSSDDAEYVRRMVAAIRDLDPLVPVYDVTTMRSRVATSLAPTTGGAAALSVVGVLALILTSLGLYGIIAQTVSGRTYEIGVRRALGARDGDVITLVVRDALVMVIAGVACGLAAAVTGAPLLRAVLYDVNPADPVVFGTAPGVLLAVSAAAAFVPAWRAIRINAATALRHD